MILPVSKTRPSQTVICKNDLWWTRIITNVCSFTHSVSPCEWSGSGAVFSFDFFLCVCPQPFFNQVVHKLHPGENHYTFLGKVWEGVREEDAKSSSWPLGFSFLRHIIVGLRLPGCNSLNNDGKSDHWRANSGLFCSFSLGKLQKIRRTAKCATFQGTIDSCTIFTQILIVSCQKLHPKNGFSHSYICEFSDLLNALTPSTTLSPFVTQTH